MESVNRRTVLHSLLASGLAAGCGGGGNKEAEAGGGGTDGGSNAATALTLTGPSTGTVGQATEAFTVALSPTGSTLARPVTVTPTDNGAGGSFAPASLALSDTSSSGQFVYTPALPGAQTVTASNDGGLSPPSGLTLTVAPRAAPLFELGWDAETPEQISIYCPLQQIAAAGTSVAVRYRAATGGSWRDAHPLLKILRDRVAPGAPTAVVDAFAGAIFDLRPGTQYEVELTVREPGKPDVVLTGNRSTRSLHGNAGPVTVRATPSSNLQTVVNTLKAGDVLELANGVYELATSSGLQLTLPGTADRPIYIRGESRAGVILRDRSGTVIQILAASHAVVENLTIEGSGVDSGTASSSQGINFYTGAGVQTNITLRYLNFVGVDVGIKAFRRIDGCLVHDCVLEGNNTWDLAYATNPASGQANFTWNDDGITLPGLGNAAWNNTLKGFGDSFAVFDGVTSAAVYFWRNRILMGGDDAFEGDYATRNIGFYDNYCTNTATLLSLDPLWGGPLYCFRNVSINTFRGPFKWNDDNSGQLVYNNTIVRTNTMNDGGWTQANNGPQINWSFRNNLLVYRGTSVNVIHLNVEVDILDFTHNAWYPDRSFNWPQSGGGFANLAAARAGLPAKATLFGSGPRHDQDVIVASNPWDTAIDLADTYQVEFSGMPWPSLSAGSTARASGTRIPGVTDGFAGAAPDRGAVITGRAEPQYGAVLPPAWAANAQSGAWIEVPMARTLSDVDPIKSPLYNPLYPNAPEWAANAGRQAQVVNAWCGAAYDELTDTMWLGLGGGHQDYAGNEVYRCKFFGDNPGWEMVRPPSGAVGNLLTTNDNQEASGVYADGRPRATHTYNKWTYVPGIGPVLASHGAASWRANNGKRWALFIDEDTGEASYGTEPTAFSINQSDGLGATYDPTRRAIWLVPGNTAPVFRYDIPAQGAGNAGTYTAVGAAEIRPGYASACYLQGHDCLLIGCSDFSETSGFWLVFDCATGQYYRPAFNGSMAIGPSHGNSQPRWVARNGAAYVWNNSTQTTAITVLTPGANPRTDAWTVSTVPVAAGNTVVPTARAANGTFGRFVHSPRLGGFLVFNSTVGPTYFFKL